MAERISNGLLQILAVSAFRRRNIHFAASGTDFLGNDYRVLHDANTGHHRAVSATAVLHRFDTDDFGQLVAFLSVAYRCAASERVLKCQVSTIDACLVDGAFSSGLHGAPGTHLPEVETSLEQNSSRRSVRTATQEIVEYAASTASDNCTIDARNGIVATSKGWLQSTKALKPPL